MIEEHWVPRTIAALPWIVKGPAVVASLLLSAFANKLPEALQNFGYYAGLALAAWVIFASIWHWTDTWLVNHSQPRLKLGPVLIVLGLIIAAAGVGYTWRGISSDSAADRANAGTSTTNPAGETTTTAPSNIPKRDSAEIARIKSRLSALYDLINLEGMPLTGTDSDIDKTLAGPRLISRSGGAIECRKHALDAKEKTTKFVQHLESFLSSNKHDADVLNPAIGDYSSAIYNFRNAMEEYAGSIPNQEQSADQLLNNDGLWDSHSQLMQAFEAYRTWIKKTLAPTTGIKKVEASL